jgi:membrane associated rhomboid family serine protease
MEDFCFHILIPMFPIWDDQVQGGSTPYLTWLFIAINVLVFLHEASLTPEWLQAFIMTRGAIPSHILAGQDYHTLFTSMFLHGSWMHLIGNMLFLYVFGDNIEARIGNFKYLMFYILGGLAAHAGHILVGGGSEIPTVGASGCISAILCAYLLMYPWSRIKMLFLQGMRVVMIPASQFLIYWIGLQFMSGVGGLMSAGAGGGVARWAHIGGFVAGVLRGFGNKHKGVWELVQHGIWEENDEKPVIATTEFEKLLRWNRNM